MANLLSIARPYALAAFEYARDHKQLDDWKTFLITAATITRNKSVQRLLEDPEIPSNEVYQLFEGVLKESMNEAQKNFLLLLAQNHRFDVLPEIVINYTAEVAALEKICSASVVTAIPATEDFKQRITEALTNKTQREVNLVYEVDPDIIGGAIIRLGDKVIDDSVRTKLTSLLEYSLR